MKRQTKYCTDPLATYEDTMMHHCIQLALLIKKTTTHEKSNTKRIT